MLISSPMTTSTPSSGRAWANCRATSPPRISSWSVIARTWTRPAARFTSACGDCAPSLQYEWTWRSARPTSPRSPGAWPRCHGRPAAETARAARPRPLSLAPSDSCGCRGSVRLAVQDALVLSRRGYAESAAHARPDREDMAMGADPAGAPRLPARQPRRPSPWGCGCPCWSSGGGGRPPAPRSPPGPSGDPWPGRPPLAPFGRDRGPGSSGAHASIEGSGRVMRERGGRAVRRAAIGRVM